MNERRVVEDGEGRVGHTGQQGEFVALKSWVGTAVLQGLSIVIGNCYCGFDMSVFLEVLGLCMPSVDIQHWQYYSRLTSALIATATHDESARLRHLC